MATIPVKNAAGATVEVELPNGNGRQAALTSRPVVLSNEDLAAIAALGTKLDALVPLLTALGANTDTLESLITASNALLTSQGGYTDGVETLIGATNSALASIAGYTDGLETLIGATNTALASVAGFVDGLEGLETAISGKLPATLGQKAAAASMAVVLPADQTPIPVIDPRMEYEAVAAAQADQVLGVAGAAGDYLSHIVIQPAALNCGAVTVKDGDTVIYTFAGGAASALADLSSRIVPIGFKSVSGAWKIGTGANVAVIGVGDFT